MLSEIELIDDLSARHTKIAIEIGITESDFHGHQRLVRLVSEGIANNKLIKAAEEMAGAFPMIEMHEVVIILKTSKLLSKWGEVFLREEEGLDLMLCHIRNGVIKMTLEVMV
jgi:hypothetical protein